MQPLLKVENLGKQYPARKSRVPSTISRAALEGVSFSIAPQTTLALVGESGSGKSTLALCIACLEPPTSGSILFEGIDVAALDQNRLRLLRPQIQLVFQDPASSLNPRWTALDIVTEPFLVQRRFTEPDRAVRALRLLDRVALPRKLAGRRAGRTQRRTKAAPRHRTSPRARAKTHHPRRSPFRPRLLRASADRKSFGRAAIFPRPHLSLHHPRSCHGRPSRRRNRRHVSRPNCRIRPHQKILSTPSHDATRSLLAATLRLVESPNILVNV